MMEDEWAHVALLSALTHVDDTALLAKLLLPAVVVLQCPCWCYAVLFKQMHASLTHFLSCRSIWQRRQPTDMHAASCFSSWRRTARATCLRTCVHSCILRSRLRLR